MDFIINKSKFTTGQKFFVDGGMLMEILFFQNYFNKLLIFFNLIIIFF